MLKQESKQTILIVENDDAQALYIKMCLEKKDYNILLAKNITEVLSILHLGSMTISLITTALMMPIVDGFTLIKYIRSRETLKDIPILCISTIINNDIKMILKNIGCSKYILKPYSSKDLINTVGELLNK